MTTADTAGPNFAPGTFAPDPGRAPLARMVAAATRFEIGLTSRNGEQLLLALVIPLAALIGLNYATIGSIPTPRIQSVTPGIFALALMSTAFTSQAIVTGFDRRYGVLKRLAATGFPSWLLLTAKALSSLAVIVGQLVIIGAVAALLGWRPHGNAGWVVLVVLLAVAAFLSLALLIGGTLRAEAVLAVANLLWLVFVGLGGVVVPLSDGPAGLRAIGLATPSGALSDALHRVLTDGLAPTPVSLAVLVGWAVVAAAAAARWFRWQ